MCCVSHMQVYVCVTCVCPVLRTSALKEFTETDQTLMRVSAVCFSLSKFDIPNLIMIFV